MKTVLLLGAGASVAEAKAQGIPKSDWPTLDKNLIDYLISNEVGAVDSLIEYAMNELNIDLKDEQISAEYLFNRIYELALKKERKGTYFSKGEMMFVLIQKLYHSAIAMTTNLVHKAKQGDYVKLLDYLDRKDGLNNTAIFTFNYDLLLEIALSELSNPKFNVPRFSIESYGIKFTSPSTSRTSSNSECFVLNGDEGNPPVLKLHGSLNWFWPETDPNDMFDTERKNIDPSKVIIDRQKKVFEKVQITNSQTRIPKTGYPVLVPPLFNKGDFYPLILDRLWKQAEAILHEAESLIIFGYSLPDADKNAKVLLKRALSKNPRIPKLNVINTDLSICEHLANNLPIKSYCYYSSVYNFLDQN